VVNEEMKLLQDLLAAAAAAVSPKNNQLRKIAYM